MAYKRLTKWNRETIRDRAVQDRFDPEREALNAEEDLIVGLMVDRFCPKKDLEIARKLDPKWLHTSSDIWVNLGGWSTTFRGHGTYIPYWIRNDKVALPVEDPLCVRARKFVEDKKSYEERRRDARLKVRGLLDSCRTLKDLKENWPEGEVYYKHLDVAPPPSLPAIRAPEVNAVLGLPKETLQ